MILTLQVMTKIIFTQEFQNLTLPSHKIITLQTENYSTLKQPSHKTSQKSISAINVQPNLPSLTHCQQTIPFYDTSFFKYKNYFQGFFLPDDYSLDIKTSSTTTISRSGSQNCFILGY